MSILGIVGSLAVDQSGLRAKLDVVSRQVSTGQRGTVYGDLAPEARRAIDLRGEVGRRDAYTDAADRALGRTGATQTVLQRLHDISTSLGAEALRARTFGTTGAEPLARSARAALEEVAGLLNTQHAGEFLFGGSDVGTPPVPDAAEIATGPMATAIATGVAGLDGTNAQTVLDDSVTAASDPASTPFSAFLETDGTTEQRRAVQSADGERIAIGVFANRDSADEVTASWGRELMRGLAILAAVTPALAEEGGGWQKLIQGVVDTLGGASTGLAAEQGRLGNAEQRLAATQGRHKDTLVALRTQLGALEEVDLAQASAEMAQVKARLEASYEATGMVSRLSLSNMLR